MVENKVTKYTIKILACVILFLFSVICIIPFILLVSASFTEESSLAKYGFSILPRVFSTDGYRAVFEHPQELLRAYGTTALSTTLSSCLSMFFSVTTAYALARPTYKWRKGINLYFLITMFVNGGQVANYLLISRWLGWTNNFLVLIIPGLVSAWNVILLRGFIQGSSMALIEAAKIDGANEYRILFQIIFPIVQTGMAIIFIRMISGAWGEWYAVLMYMPTEKYITIQYYLQKILQSAQELLDQQAAGVMSAGDYANLPRENMRMAICILATAPMMLVFQFFQKYMRKGLQIGSVKG